MAVEILTQASSDEIREALRFLAYVFVGGGGLTGTALLIREAINKLAGGDVEKAQGLENQFVDEVAKTYWQNEE